MRAAYLVMAVLCLGLCVMQVLLTAYFIRRDAKANNLYIIFNIAGLAINIHTLWTIWPKLF